MIGDLLLAIALILTIIPVAAVAFYFALLAALRIPMTLLAVEVVVILGVVGIWLRSIGV